MYRMLLLQTEMIFGVPGTGDRGLNATAARAIGTRSCIGATVTALPPTGSRPRLGSSRSAESFRPSPRLICGACGAVAVLEQNPDGLRQVGAAMEEEAKELELFGRRKFGAAVVNLDDRRHN